MLLYIQLPEVTAEAQKWIETSALCCNKEQHQVNMIPALSGGDVAILEVVTNSVRITCTVLTTNESIKTKRLRQANVTVSSSDTWRTDTLTTHRVTQSTSTLTPCHTQ